MTITNLGQLEHLLSGYELKFMYIAPGVDEPIRHWWPPQGHEPYQHHEAEGEPFPKQSEIFWVLCEELGRPPTQDEFGVRFFQTYKSFAKWSHLFRDAATKWGVEARARRTYPSFVREYHVRYLLEAVFGANHVDSGDALDRSGADFIVKVGSNWHPVRTYVDTKRSNAYAKDKAEVRHVHVLGDGAYDLRLPLQDAHNVGQFKLYGEKHVLELQEAIHGNL